MRIFSLTKIPQPLPLNSTRSNEKPLFFDPSRSTSNFLGSRFRLPSLSKSITRSRSSTVVAVSDVLKEKKLKPTSNLVLFPILDCRRLFLFTDFSFGGNGVIQHEFLLSMLSWNRLAFTLFFLLIFNLFDFGLLVLVSFCEFDRWFCGYHSEIGDYYYYFTSAMELALLNYQILYKFVLYWKLLHASLCYINRLGLKVVPLFWFRYCLYTADYKRRGFGTIRGHDIRQGF